MPMPNADDPLRTTDHVSISDPETDPEAVTTDDRGDPPGANATGLAGRTTVSFQPKRGELTDGSAGTPSGPPPSIPSYEVEGVLGRCGMGVVYKARHLAVKRTVALKMMLVGGHAGPEELARFRTEAEAVARLRVGPQRAGHHGLRACRGGPTRARPCLGALAPM